MEIKNWIINDKLFTLGKLESKYGMDNDSYFIGICDKDSDLENAIGTEMYCMVYNVYNFNKLCGKKNHNRGADKLYDTIINLLDKNIVHGEGTQEMDTECKQYLSLGLNEFGDMELKMYLNVDTMTNGESVEKLNVIGFDLCKYMSVVNILAEHEKDIFYYCVDNMREIVFNTSVENRDIEINEQS